MFSPINCALIFDQSWASFRRGSGLVVGYYFSHHLTKHGHFTFVSNCAVIFRLFSSPHPRDLDRNCAVIGHLKGIYSVVFWDFLDHECQGDKVIAFAYTWPHNVFTLKRIHCCYSSSDLATGRQKGHAEVDR